MGEDVRSKMALEALDCPATVSVLNSDGSNTGFGGFVGSAVGFKVGKCVGTVDCLTVVFGNCEDVKP